jgi:hypothetical protein
VSAVISSGQSIGTFSGPTGGTVSYDGRSGSVSGYTSLSGSSISSLATLLKSPPEPNKPTGYGCLWIPIVFPFIAVIAVIFGGFFVGVAYIPLSLVLSPTAMNDAQTFLPFYSIGVVIGIFFGFRFFIKRDKKNKTKGGIRYSTQKPQWDNAMQKWNRLYYCHKHDVVFDPENGETCAPVSLKEFLYQSNSG